MEAAQGTGLTVLPGIEIQTQEDVHVLCLFDELDQLLDLQFLVANLPRLENNIEFQSNLSSMRRWFTPQTTFNYSEPQL